MPGPCSRHAAFSSAPRPCPSPSVEPETACYVNSKRKLEKAKKDLADKVSKNKGALKEKDIEDLDKVAKIIEGIFRYCKNKEYTK